jgi:hypothetical protein
MKSSRNYFTVAWILQDWGIHSARRLNKRVSTINREHETLKAMKAKLEEKLRKAKPPPPPQTTTTDDYDNDDITITMKNDDDDDDNNNAYNNNNDE